MRDRWRDMRLNSSTQFTFTKFGHLVLGKLAALRVLVLFIGSDNRKFNEVLNRRHEERKAEVEKIDPAEMEQFANAGIDVTNWKRTYSGENGADKNRPYTEALEATVGESFLCRAVDYYHWYLRCVLQQALSRDSTLIRSWAPVLGLKEKRIAKIESAAPTAQTIQRLFRGREGVFRQLVHQHLNVSDLGTIPALVAVRNCVVHNLGEDIDGEVARLISGCSELGIEVDNGQVKVSDDASYEAIGRIFSDITLIDQMLVNVLDLPVIRQPIPALKRQLG